MDCDLVCSAAWMGKVSGPVIRPASMKKKVTDSGMADGCTMMAVSWSMRRTISGSWPRMGLSLSTLACRAAAFSNSRLVEAWSRCAADFADQGVAAAVEVGLHAADFGPVVVVGAAFEAGGEAHFHFGVDAAGKVLGRDGGRRRSGAS